MTTAGAALARPPFMRRVLLPFEISPHAPEISGSVQHLHGQTMGTTWSVKLVLADMSRLSSLQIAIEQALDSVVMQMSTWLPDSNLSRFNAAPPGGWHSLPDDFFRVLDYGLQVSADSGGAFDVTSGALVELWGFGPTRSPDDARHEPPTTMEVANALGRCGWQRVTLDREQRCARQEGVRLDFSAIAKGFAVDRLSELLQHRGIDHHLVEIGGELRGCGCKPDGQPWWVTLESPNGAAHDADLIALHGLAVATSGDYRRYFELDGKRYSHSIDPRRGRPIDNEVAAVTVVHSDCMTADALSTALTVMGAEEGLQYAEHRGLAARFVLRTAAGFSEHCTPVFNAMLQ